MPGLALAVPTSPPSDAPSAGLELRLFGPMEVCVGGRPMARLRSRKGLWLLALLALRGGSYVERSWLAGTLWPECREANALRSLRQSLHDLRVALGSEAHRLASEGMRTLRLDPSGAAVDVLAFDAATRRGDLDSLETAVRLFRGPFLEGCAEEWVLPERAAREQSFLLALARLASSAAARREYAAAAGYLRRAVATDPYREDFQRELMHALAENGSPAEALLVYRDFRSLLLREMAAEPTDETTALFRRLREEARARASRRAPEGSPSRSPAAPRSQAPSRPSLPRPVTELIGRDEDVREVVGRLARSRLVTLSGAGGVGKTRLALEVAEQFAGEHEGGAAFANLAPLADPGDIPNTLLAALGVSPAAREEPLKTLRRHLSDSQTLLVLDNCEHLLDGCAALAETLIAGCAGIRILATSRQSLGIGGEAVWRVPSLLFPPRSETSEAPFSTLNQYPAVRLFAERARAADASFELTPRDAAAVVQVCRRLDGMPLGIELAAARVRVMPVVQIASRLDDRFRLLTGGARTALPRHQTLRASIDWSCDLLSEPERVLMARLSVFAGGWTLEAAEAVSAGEPLPEPEIMELLLSLVDKSLVLYEEGEAAGRYRLLETVREYFAARLATEREEEQSVRDRHLQYFQSLGEQAAPHLTGADQQEWLERLELEHDNLRDALEWATGADPEAGLRLAEALWRFWDIRGHVSQGRQRLARALACAADGAPAARARALNGAGLLAWRQGACAAARALFEEGLAISRELGQQSWTADGLANLGTLASERGDYPAARALIEESLAIHRELGNRHKIAAVLNNLGSIALDQRDYSPARALYEESIAIKREIGDRNSLVSSLNNLGAAARQQGDYEFARALHEEGLAIATEVGNRVGVGLSLGCLGSLAGVQGNYESARALHEESLAIHREVGDRRGTAGSLKNLGRIVCDQGDYPVARALLAESLAIGRDLDDRFGIAASLEHIAALEAAGGEAACAALLWGAAEGLREAIGAPLPPAEAASYQEMLAALRSALGDAGMEQETAAGRAMSLTGAMHLALSK